MTQGILRASARRRWSLAPLLLAPMAAAAFVAGHLPSPLFGTASIGAPSAIAASQAATVLSLAPQGAALGHAPPPRWLRREPFTGGSGGTAIELFDGLGLAVRPVSRKDWQACDDIARWLAAALAADPGQAANGQAKDPAAALRLAAQAFRPGSPLWPSLRAVRYHGGTQDGNAGSLIFEVFLIGSLVEKAAVDVGRLTLMMTARETSGDDPPPALLAP